MGRTGGGYVEEELTETIIQCAIVVHQELGPGFVEKIYQNAMVLELLSRGIEVETEKEICVYYAEKPVGKHRLDLLVAGRVIVENKAIEELTKVDYARLRSYLKATNLRVAILINFAKERADFRRVELNRPQ